jgi:hypothetical protein
MAEKLLLFLAPSSSVEERAVCIRVYEYLSLSLSLSKTILSSLFLLPLSYKK